MKKKKSNLPKWKYDFSCKKCRHIQYVKDKAKRRDGDYCIKFIERTDAGLPSPIHADDDRIVRFNRDKADYINIIAWRQTAEFVAKHFAKGQRVAVVGSIQTRSWEDNDGGKHKAVEIVADSVYFADAKKESAAGSYAESAMTSEGFEVTDEDIPF